MVKKGKSKLEENYVQHHTTDSYLAKMMADLSPSVRKTELHGARIVTTLELDQVDWPLLWKELYKWLEARVGK